MRHRAIQRLPESSRSRRTRPAISTHSLGPNRSPLHTKETALEANHVLDDQSYLSVNPPVLLKTADLAVQVTPQRQHGNQPNQRYQQDKWIGRHIGLVRDGYMNRVKKADS